MQVAIYQMLPCHHVHFGTLVRLVVKTKNYAPFKIS